MGSTKKRVTKRTATSAGPFVAKEIRAARKEGSRRSVKQLIAIGLSKARRAGVKFAKAKRLPNLSGHSNVTRCPTCGSKRPRRRGR